MSKMRGLGRGIETLIPAPKALPAATGTTPGDSWELAVEKIIPSRWQPRRAFDATGLEELAASIAAHGLMSPLVVRKAGDGIFELVAGERRLRAMRDILQWEKAPVRLMNAEDAVMRELALVENLQRADLNPIEIANAYHELKKELGLTHEAVADRLKVSRPQVTNFLRLLELPEEIKELVASGKLPVGSARALLPLSNPMAQIKLARKAVEEELSTRQVERLAAESRKTKTPPQPKPAAPDIAFLEERLRRHLGSKVTVDDHKGKGKIVIEYYSLAEAQGILDRMGLPGE